VVVTLGDAEEFFIDKVRSGLQELSDPLTDDDEAVLRMPVLEAVSLGRDLEDHKTLQARCVGGLVRAYERDIEVAKSMRGRVPIREDPLTLVMEIWVDNFRSVFEASQLVISPIVQHWYNVAGQRQQRKAAGCAVVLLGLVGVAIACGATAVVMMTG
jgi:hypothetical protein